MEYTAEEKQLLSLLDRTDFKNISKNELVSYASKLNELRPEVATQVIAKYPELTSLIKTSLNEYKEMIDTLVMSDDASVTQAYAIFNKEIDQTDKSRKDFYEFADKVRADLNRCLDNPDLSSEERKEIIEREIEILNIVNKKDSEIRDKEMEVVHMADKKDTEKRLFNWKVISGASAVVLVAVGFGTAALGGNFKFKLPKKI